jgi:hypothetical protein
MRCAVISHGQTGGLQILRLDVIQYCIACLCVCSVDLLLASQNRIAGSTASVEMAAACATMEQLFACVSDEIEEWHSGILIQIVAMIEESMRSSGASGTTSQEMNEQQNRDRHANQPRQDVAPAALLMSPQCGHAAGELRECAVHAFLLVDLWHERSLQFNVAGQLFGPIPAGTVSAQPQLL